MNQTRNIRFWEITIGRSAITRILVCSDTDLKVFRPTRILYLAIFTFLAPGCQVFLVRIRTRLFLLLPGVLFLPVGAGRTRSLPKPKKININEHYLMTDYIHVLFLPVGAGRSLPKPKENNINGHYLMIDCIHILFLPVGAGRSLRLLKPKIVLQRSFNVASTSSLVQSSLSAER